VGVVERAALRRAAFILVTANLVDVAFPSPKFQQVSDTTAHALCDTVSLTSEENPP